MATAAQLADKLKRCREESGRLAADARRASGGNPTNPCLVEVAPPRVIPADPSTFRWIKSDDTPPQVDRWPVLVSLPAGWVEISPEEATRLRRGIFRAGIPALLDTSVEADVARLSAIGDVRPAVTPAAERRPPRTPRVPREPRAPRVPRESRPSRMDRLTRRSRMPRPPRRPRPARAPRAPRPRMQKTKLSIGVCKRPGCTCWTPAGCASDVYYSIIKAIGFDNPECFPGPCFDYTACVSGRCFSDLTCAIIGIVQFWQRQYRYVVQGQLAPVVAEVGEAVRGFAAIENLRKARFEQLVEDVVGPKQLTEGCPPGWYWVIGLTGCRCVPKEAGVPPATREQIIACLGYDPGFGIAG